MTSREYLERLRTIDREIEALQAENLRLQSDIMNISAIDYSKDRITGGKPLDISDKIARLELHSAKVANEWAELLELRAEARNYISLMENPIHRAVLIERYINNWAWEKIMKSLNYSWAQVHRHHGTALQEFNKVFDK